MLRELLNQPKVVGVKQSRRAVREGRATLVLLAVDADPVITHELAVLCREHGVDAQCAYTMSELGKAAGIHVGAAVVALVRH